MDMNRKIPALMTALALIAMLLWQITMRSVASTFSFADDGGEKCIYLTFDDGPSDKVTPKILDVLKEEDVCATFFIVGMRAEPRKYLVKRQFDEGHTVAIHSYSHIYGEIYAGAQNLLQDIEKCNQIIREVTGEFSSVYRFPGGSAFAGKQLKSAVEESGFTCVDWNAGFCDEEIDNPTPKQLYDCAVKTAGDKERVVMLAHDSTDRTTTAQALKDVIRYFKAKGYTFKKL